MSAASTIYKQNCSQESFGILFGLLAKSFARTFPASNRRTVVLEAQSPKAKCKVCALLYNDTLLIALMTESGTTLVASRGRREVLEKQTLPSNVLLFSSRFGASLA